jgi:hypothetical protein
VIATRMTEDEAWWRARACSLDDSQREQLVVVAAAAAAAAAVVGLVVEKEEEEGSSREETRRTGREESGASGSGASEGSPDSTRAFISVGSDKDEPEEEGSEAQDPHRRSGQEEPCSSLGNTGGSPMRCVFFSILVCALERNGAHDCKVWRRFRYKAGSPCKIRRACRHPLCSMHYESYPCCKGYRLSARG